MYYGVAGLAKMLGVKPWKVRRWLANGVLSNFHQTIEVAGAHGTSKLHLWTPVNAGLVRELLKLRRPRTKDRRVTTEAERKAKAEARAARKKAKRQEEQRKKREHQETLADLRAWQADLLGLKQMDAERWGDVRDNLYRLGFLTMDDRLNERGLRYLGQTGASRASRLGEPSRLKRVKPVGAADAGTESKPVAGTDGAI